MIRCSQCGCMGRAQFIFQQMNKAGVFASSQAVAYWSYSALRTGVLASQVWQATNPICKGS